MTDMTGDTEPRAIESAVPDGDNHEAKFRAALEKTRLRGEQLRRSARANYRAMEGSLSVRSEEDWMGIFEQSREQYESGGFLLDRLGAERVLDPKLIATLLSLRQRLIAEWGITTAAETMLVDLAVLHYYHTLRVQGWIGDLAMHIEHQFFGSGAFAAEYRDLPPETRRAAETRVRRLTEQLMPLLDRANRMLIRNLTAIKELRQRMVPAIAIGRADRVTVRQTGRGPLRPVKRALERRT